MDYFCSIAKHPGKTGEYFYSKFFEYYGIAAEYRAIGVLDLDTWITSNEWRKYSGISVSMPFKSEVLTYLDFMDDYVTDLKACNSVKIEKNLWTGFNTDFYGVLGSIQAIPEGASIQILGDGSMSRAYQHILSQIKREFMVFSRRLGNWEERNSYFDCRINTTSFGTKSPESPFAGEFKASLMIDLAISNGDLLEQCESFGIKYIGGMSFYQQVFTNQFRIYTGIELDPDLFWYFYAIKYE
jgi:shikimate dehydrogenase